MAGQRRGAGHGQTSPARLCPPGRLDGGLQAASRADLGRRPESRRHRAARLLPRRLCGGLSGRRRHLEPRLGHAGPSGAHRRLRLAGPGRASFAPIEPDRRSSRRCPAVVCQARCHRRHPLWLPTGQADRTDGVSSRRSAGRGAVFHRRRHGHCPLQRIASSTSRDGRAAGRRLPARADLDGCGRSSASPAALVGCSKRRQSAAPPLPRPGFCRLWSRG